MAGIVSLKASIEVWDQVDSLLRRSIDTYARTLEHIAREISRRAGERFGIKGLELTTQLAALAQKTGTPESRLLLLERVGCEVESELRTFGEQLCEHACSSQDLVDVAATLDRTIAGILQLGGKHEQQMRTAAARLRTANEAENVAALRILVRYQSTELLRLADESAQENATLAASLRAQVTQLTISLGAARLEGRRDALTGLLNRRALEELRLDFEEKDTPRCLIMIDLDRFKSINDKYGHLAGDELLRQVALRIQSTLPGSCAAARWGGDEFIVLVDGPIDVGMSVTQQLDQQLRTRYRLGEGRLQSVFAQASVGLSNWRAGESADTVVQRADLALKTRKRSARVPAAEPPQ